MGGEDTSRDGVEPCPICGGGTHWHPKETTRPGGPVTYDLDLGFIECVHSCVRTSGISARQVAVRTWNRRVEPAATAGEVGAMLSLASEIIDSYEAEAAYARSQGERTDGWDIDAPAALFKRMHQTLTRLAGDGRDAVIELEAARLFGGGYFGETVTEATREHYRAAALRAMKGGA